MHKTPAALISYTKSSRKGVLYIMNNSVIVKDYIESRVYEIAQYILATNCTVRAAAKKFEVSKSTVHKDLVERLPNLSQGLADEVRKILDENKAERHIRGGLATKAKYEAERQRERQRNK